MTTGQLLFWSGAALLALTGLLAIIFAIKKPKYTPEEAVALNARGDALRERLAAPPARTAVGIALVALLVVRASVLHLST